MTATEFWAMYIGCGVVTTFLSAVYHGSKPGADWHDFLNDGTPFWGSLGLGVIWPLTAITFLPYYFGMKGRETRERREAAEKERKRIEEEQRKADDKLLQLDAQRRAAALAGAQRVS